MSQPPTPARYGPPPGPPAPRRGLSNVAKFWIGVVLCIPALFVAGALLGLPSVAVDALSLPHEVGALLGFGMGLALLGGLVAGIVIERTRWFALGVIAGFATLFVLAAGACVLLLAGLASGY